MTAEGEKVGPPIERLKNFKFGDIDQTVKFVEATAVKPGVACDVYEFEGDTTKDLGIIYVEPGTATPLQEVLKGDRTIEGYISGKGTFTITSEAGEKQVYSVDAGMEKFEKTVNIGEKMQWQVAPDAQDKLVAY